MSAASQAVNEKLWAVFLRQLECCATGSRLAYRIAGRVVTFVKFYRDDESVFRLTTH